ncbi:MAG: HEAT repeat domain-containing protein [Proteobacteria bacterium]|nr:HEAT repeat domain-containing protein [Desulfobulbaceae bacterium]MBU4153099.1 HEAT repeat domain-containing protein [Pseudomonadota bacterium]MDP2106074.1 HEAT repeat domain-containing protein [Desulfobulbaceae bacterium]
MDKSNTEQLTMVITDFLEIGHVDNIIAMFKQDHTCLTLTGALIQDERFKVRMGMAVLFEDLATALPKEVMSLAVPSLLKAMEHPAAYVRGDAAYLLMTIRSSEAMDALARFQHDPDPQVAEIIREGLGW